MTHTLNRVNLGVDTIAKYLNNIFLYPEEKYHKIQVQNKTQLVIPLLKLELFKH